MSSIAHAIIVSFIDNELLMMIAIIAMLTVASIDKSLSRFQKKLTYAFAAFCMLYALLIFIGFGIGTSSYSVSASVRIACATLVNIIRPVPLMLVTCGLSESLAKNKWYYVPFILNAVLFLINIKTNICFIITSGDDFTKKPCFYIGLLIFLMYFCILTYVYQKYPLMVTFKQRATSIIIISLIPLATFSEVVSNRNVLGTSMLLADIFEYELLIVLKSNALLKDTEKDLKQTKRDSISDDMTGLLNRRAYDRKIEKEAEKTYIDSDFTIIMCDINGLKTGNDTYGHEVGDEMIKGAAECLKTALKPFGEIYRIGGDEFTGWLNCSETELADALREMDALCEQWTNPYVGHLSISKGYARVSDYPEKSIQELIQIADKKMYEDKQNYYQTHNLNGRR